MTEENNKPYIYFYFDSKSLYNSLLNYENEKAICSDKGDEFEFILDVNKSEELIGLIYYLFYTCNLSKTEIESLDQLWGGRVFWYSRVSIRRKKADEIIESAAKYLDGLEEDS